MKRHHEVKIYTSGTAYCTLAREYLRQQGIDADEVSVTKNPKALKELQEKTGQTETPVVIFDGRVIIGYRPDVYQTYIDEQ